MKSHNTKCATQRKVVNYFSCVIPFGGENWMEEIFLLLLKWNKIARTVNMDKGQMTKEYEISDPQTSKKGKNLGRNPVGGY